MKLAKKARSAAYANRRRRARAALSLGNATAQSRACVRSSSAPGTFVVAEITGGNGQYPSEQFVGSVVAATHWVLRRR